MHVIVKAEALIWDQATLGLTSHKVSVHLGSRILGDLVQLTIETATGILCILVCKVSASRGGYAMQ